MTHQTHTEMVDSGIEWIGKIPKGWEVRKLKYISKCFDNMRKPLNWEERWEVEWEWNIPYYWANGIVDYIWDYIFDDDIVLVWEDWAPFLDKTKDIAFNIAGKCWVNNHAHILKWTAIKNKYLTHCLNKVDYSLLVWWSTREKLTQWDLMSIWVPLPPLTTQQAIASYLDDKTAQIEQAISLKQSQIELLKEKRSALINHVVTKWLDHNVELVDSGIEWIGEIPKGWEVTKVWRICTVWQWIQVDVDKQFDNLEM